MPPTPLLLQQWQQQQQQLPVLVPPTPELFPPQQQITMMMRMSQRQEFSPPLLLKHIFFHLACRFIVHSMRKVRFGSLTTDLTAIFFYFTTEGRATDVVYGQIRFFGGAL